VLVGAAHNCLMKFGVSRICEKSGQHTRVRKLNEKSISSFPPTEADRAGWRSLARLAKREGDFELPVTFGKTHSASRATAMRPTSSWRFTTNTRRVIQSKLNKSSGRRLTNFAPFR